MSSTSTDAAQAKGSFMRLPAELRVLIYEQMFPPDKFHVYAIKGTLHRQQKARHCAGDYTGILSTCRTVHAESEPVLYTNTEFCIHVRDHYWLHLMDKARYENVFDRTRYHKPGRKQWLAENPWLRNPRSIVSLDKVRKLCLKVEVSTSAEAVRWTWTNQLRHTLRNASNIQTLHIMLEDIDVVFFDLDIDQDQTDHVLGIIGETMQCAGTVTAALDHLLGSIEFQPASYYRMLTVLGGIDKTDDLIAEAICSLEKDLCTIETTLDNSVVLLNSFKQSLLYAYAMQERGDLTALRPLVVKSDEIKKETQWMRNKMNSLRRGIAKMKIQRAALNEGRETYLRTVASAKDAESAEEI